MDRGERRGKTQARTIPASAAVPGALLIFAAVVPENHLYRESSGQQTAQDPVVPVIRSENGETLKSAVVQSKVKTDPLNLNAHAVVLLDGDTGRILYGKKMRRKFFPWPAPRRS